jgi:L-alanine-DL-glutamate epimerase-like enolase superfamily enzyme
VTTLIPIEHVTRSRRGLVLRRGGRLGEASPLVGRSIETVDDVLRALALGEPAPASLDFALWALDTTLAPSTIRSQLLLEDASTALLVARAAVAAGQLAFKLKIRSRADAEIAVELRALAPAAVIRVDANRAFASERDVPWDTLARARVEWIEEPCPDAGSLIGTPVAIALDESVAYRAASALESVAAHGVTALVLKPTLLGATETLRIARECRRLGGRVIVSHAFESDIGRRAAEELARRIDPDETHGLGRWEGIDAYRIRAGGAPLRSLLATEEASRVDSALG